MENAFANNRLTRRFAALKAEDRAGLVVYVTASDPDLETSAQLLAGLPGAGADIIELGMPFSDPMADGPSIQRAALRALASGACMNRTLAMVKDFRKTEADTPVVLMGYYNPIDTYGAQRFAIDAAAAGVDGVIVVDVPPEEADEIQPVLAAHGVAFICLSTPTSDDARLPAILKYAGGFLYYVSVLGITGTVSAAADAVAAAVARLKRHTSLPIAVGFGIKTPQAAATVARVADAAVVGSAVIDRLAAGLDANGKPTPRAVPDTLAFVADLAQGVRGARQ
ncbi:tryptophan synthase subunit alpha [Oleispirillum naphthae]|uniref:tryptophan synthase subunit alpha n=1 Tax=Oleispirillum naphthae TaxID=2838853 RepID=UPI0030822F93